MRRGYAAAVAGPIAIDIGLFAQDGWVKVQVAADCTSAMIGLSTAEDDGPSSAAVQAATVGSSLEGGLIATLHGTNGATPVEITVVAPPGSTLIARTDSAHIGAIGLAEAELTTGSGNIAVPAAGRVYAETASGDVTIRRSTDATVTTHSGTISVIAGDRVTARTTSGDLRLGTITGDLTAKSVSGNLTVRDFRGAKLKAEATSGGITLHATTNAIVHAATVSGDITITATTTLNLKTTTATGRITTPPTG
jgi:putative adhesin